MLHPSTGGHPPRLPITCALRLAALCVFGSMLAPATVPAELVQVDQVAMGGPLSFRVYARDGDEARARDAIRAARVEVERLEDLLSSYRPESEISRLNQAAGGAPLRVSPETLSLVVKSIEIGELTEGAFDITFAPLGQLWSSLGDPPELPAPAAVAAARALVDYRRLEIDLATARIRLPVAQMQLGLGGIAKGYIVDQAAEVLRRRGFDRFMIDAAGDVRVDGSPPDRQWMIAVRHPRSPEGVLVTLPVSDASVVTSGDYERFTMLDGKRYSHIIDPTTGYPASGVQSATVISRDTGIADALATGVFVLGPVEGLGLMERLPGVEGLIVDADGRLYTTSGLDLSVFPIAD